MKRKRGEVREVVFKNSLMLVEHNIAFILYKTAHLPATPQSKRDGSGVKVIMLSEDLFDVASGFLGVVVGHGGEEVVSNLGIGNVVMQVVDQGTIVTIDSKSSTALEVPDTFTIMRQDRVGVLEISDQHKPKVDEQVGDKVVLEHGDGSKSMASIGNTSNSAKHTDIRNYHISYLVLLVNSAPGVIVRSPAGIILTSNVDKKIERPSKGEHDHHADENIQRSLFENAVRSISFWVILTFGKSSLGTSLWDEHLIKIRSNFLD